METEEVMDVAKRAQQSDNGGGGGQFRWLFLGRGPMGAAALEVSGDPIVPTVVLTDASTADGQMVLRMAARLDIPVQDIRRLGSDPARSWPELFGDLHLAVCCAWPERLQSKALRAPRHGWLNLHPSSLPAWRGANPVSWQLLVAPSQIGCSVHRMAERFDSGPVIARGSAVLSPDDDGRRARGRCGSVLGRLAGQVVAQIAAGAEVAEEPQRESDATWCPPLGTVPLVNPTGIRAAAGAQIARAFSPRPGIAMTPLPRDQLFAFDALGQPLAGGERPGMVAEPGDGRIAVAFRDRWLLGFRREA